jgi:glucose/arabinose dehydrogenase
LALALVGAMASSARAAVALDQLRLPPGVRIELVTDAVPNARQIALGLSVDGWLQGESAWGRPADVLVLPDGSLLVSDDLAGAIYRIRYAP